MKFICPFIFAVLLAAPLWAKTSYYILPVHLKNVHEDYAEKIVSLTKEYVAVEGDEVVPNKSDCDYLLQMSFMKSEARKVSYYGLMDILLIHRRTLLLLQVMLLGKWIAGKKNLFVVSVLAL